MAAEALVGVVAGSQPVRVGGELREKRVELALPGRRRPISNHGALVAGGFQLPSPVDAFHERGKFVGCYGSACRRVWTDSRRMRNLDALGLKPATGVFQAAPYPRVRLRKTRTCQQTHECGGCCAKDNRAPHLCHEVTLLRALTRINPIVACKPSPACSHYFGR